MLKKINLQLFADVEPESDVELDANTNDALDMDDIEIDDSIDDSKGEVAQDKESTQGNDDSENMNDDKLETQQEKMVPLSALEAERKKWKERVNNPALKKAKEIADKLTRQTGKDIDTILSEMDAFEIQAHIDQGIPENVARSIVQQQRQIAEVTRALNKQKRDAEFEALKKDEFYSDAENFRDELEEFADRTGLSIEQAYNALFAKNKINDIATQIEQRVLNNISKKQSKKINTDSNGEVINQPKVKLTPDEIEFAKMAGMTPQEYYTMKNLSGIDQYRKFKKG